MATRNSDDAYEDDMVDDDIFDDDLVNDEDMDEATIACPYCRQEIHEDAQRCPYCEQYISREDVAAERKPWWVILGVAICLYIVFSWFLWG